MLLGSGLFIVLIAAVGVPSSGHAASDCARCLEANKPDALSEILRLRFPFVPTCEQQMREKWHKNVRPIKRAARMPAYIYHMKTALERKAGHQIPDPGIWVLSEYTSAGFQDMNTALLRQGPFRQEWNPALRAANATLRKRPPYQALVRRNVMLGQTDRWISFLLSLKKGGVIRNPIYASSTKRLQAPIMGDFPLIIESKTGRSISDISLVPAEKEVLFPPGSIFRIKEFKLNLFTKRPPYVLLEDISDEAPTAKLIASLKRAGLDYDAILEKAEELLAERGLPDDGTLNDDELVALALAGRAEGSRILRPLGAPAEAEMRFPELHAAYRSALKKLPLCSGEAWIARGRRDSTNETGTALIPLRAYQPGSGLLIRVRDEKDPSGMAEIRFKSGAINPLSSDEGRPQILFPRPLRATLRDGTKMIVEELP